MTNKNFIPFYEMPEWVELLGEQGYRGLTNDDQNRYIKLSIEDGHKRHYYAALVSTNTRGPIWEDLTAEQQEHVRQANRDYQNYMNELGISLLTGQK